MIAELVHALYAALAAGDRAAVENLLADDFVAEFSAGLGAPIGGRHRGSVAIDRGWWEIGRRFAVTAMPAELIDTVDGRMLVLGHYRGRARRNPDAPDFSAAFAHLWSAGEDRITGLIQITDTAAWVT